MTLTVSLEKAIQVSAKAHHKQKRKGTDIPYIIHPFSVMLIASEATNDEDILIACLFHDILEDVPEEYSEQQMYQDFGQRVVGIVQGVTKDSSIADWRVRSEAYLYQLEFKASDESVLVSAADKIHNMMSKLADYQIIGENLWDKFGAGKESQLWWYAAVLEVLKKRMPDCILVPKFKYLLDELRLVTQN